MHASGIYYTTVSASNASSHFAASAVNNATRTKVTSHFLTSEPAVGTIYSFIAMNDSYTLERNAIFNDKRELSYLGMTTKQRIFVATAPKDDHLRQLLAKLKLTVQDHYPGRFHWTMSWNVP